MESANPGPEEMRLVTVVALCGVERDSGKVTINRKFHTGMTEYAKRLGNPVACLLPRLTSKEAGSALDLIEVPVRELPYAVHVVSGRKIGATDMPTIEQVVGQSALVYCGPTEGLNVTVIELCRAHGTPYVVTCELSLRTRLDIMRVSTPGLARRLWREIKVRYRHRRLKPILAFARELHANGYPAYFEYRKTNPDTVLFFGSRISDSDLIPTDALLQRLEVRANTRQPFRLLYTGRYSAIKGVLDVVTVAVELLRRGLDFRLDLFGAGPLKAKLVEIIRRHDVEQKITVNDPVPFRPDLIELTRQCDAFICCHVQGDPSCTYLETLASGVPIIGYDNEMWSPLCRESGGGVVGRSRDPIGLADLAQSFLADYDRLRLASLKAREFAATHTMERAWDLRCRRIEAVLRQTVNARG